MLSRPYNVHVEANPKGWCIMRGLPGTRGAIAAGIAMAACGMASIGIAGSDNKPPASKPGATPQELLAATSRGMAWLADQQKPDGSFGSGSQYGRHVGITALSALAFMSDGHTPGRGKYGGHVDKALKFILEYTSDESGLICAETSYGPMYGHGFATLFLAEVYGMARQPDVREKLRKAVRLIIGTQNDAGGWRYHPVKADADLSVTICQVMALRAARNAGIDVPKSTIDKAISYVRRSQNPDGGFRYMLDSTGSMFPRSAAGIAALFYAGMYEGPEISNGLKYLMQFLPGKSQSQGHYYYGQYYAAQAMFQAGGTYWKQWWPAIRDELLEKQTEEGYWQGEAGNEYGTAMAIIVLRIPDGLLPIFQK